MIYVSEAFLAYLLLTYLALVAPVEVEQVELGLAAREAHFAFGDVVEELRVEEQIVEFGFRQHVSYMTQLFEGELQAIALITGCQLL